MTVHDTNRPASPGGGSLLQRLALDAGTLVRLSLGAAILGVLYVMFHFHGVTDIGYDFTQTSRSAFVWLWKRWEADLLVTRFAHSHWVPLVSLALVMWDWRALARLPRRINWLGLAVVALACVVHWGGVKSEQTRLTILAMILFSWGIPFFICGWPVARRLMFPCGLLVFSLPLNFFDFLAQPLQAVAAVVTSGLINGLGIEVTRNGTELIGDFPDTFRLQLADGRSGIFALTAVGAFSLACAYVARVRWAGAAIVVAAAAPLLVLANIVRGVATLAAAAMGGPSAGQWIEHHAAGPVVCLVAFGGIAAMALAMRKRFPLMPAPHAPLAHVDQAPVTGYVIALAVIGAAAAWIPGNLHIRYIDQADIALDMPAELGLWKGQEVLYCHANHEPNSFQDPTLAPGQPCPVCGEPLHEMSHIERVLLPPDTTVRKFHYEHPRGNELYFSIVLGGKHRSSIHRPEVCLVGPFSQISDTLMHRVPLKDGDHLDVKILEMIQIVRRPDGSFTHIPFYYAYWFSGSGRETPSHLQRMYWMATDRLFRNQSYRWAYISLSGGRAADQRTYIQEIDLFIQDAYTDLMKPRRDRDQQPSDNKNTTP